MTERAREPGFEGDERQLEMQYERNRFLFAMPNYLYFAVRSRQNGEPIEDYGPKQTKATQYINLNWPRDDILQLGFEEPVPVFSSDGLHYTDRTTSKILVNRHAGFGRAGALFVNDSTGESVYVGQPLDTDFSIINR